MPTLTILHGSAVQRTWYVFALTERRGSTDDGRDPIGTVTAPNHPTAVVFARRRFRASHGSNLLVMSAAEYAIVCEERSALARSRGAINVRVHKPGPAAGSRGKRDTTSTQLSA